MPDSIAQSVGVDIAKDTLEVHLHPAGRCRRFGNDTKGCAALIAWAEGFVIARVAFEPTGAYHCATCGVALRPRSPATKSAVS